MSETPQITATVAAFARVAQTLDTLRRLEACRPPPAEIIVHVDAARHDCADAVRAAFPAARVIVSETRVGPGGGRSRMTEAARHALIAAFDDDSYPLDADFFARAGEIFARFPDLSLATSQIVHPGETPAPDRRALRETCGFNGGGAVFRRSHLLEAGGYLPLPLAYGVEEEDMALRLIERGRRLVFTPYLRVFHNSDLAHHAEPRINAASIANIALLAFLRYPPRFYPLAALQITNRVFFCLRMGRRGGVLAGLAMIPHHLWRMRAHRRLVSKAAVAAKLALRKGGWSDF
ncbi:glycosyltransferase family 2 protein [Methylosinus sp. LW4]|uniref:glycosyltransferase family 2 protein n=1 Tax=Methylosinus sp. LW4 TaxID=136993 RepID=UPI00039FB801|nr:glycosyltransferase [Methylosinus sp. LW4]